ncbi:MAG: hypothetical protein CMC33_02450 [Flavobacteriaceae bacterium]|nr:hypothetical protein [Flavobacteriaceae bacterium]|tara:strand:- start:59 stop:517 length:459 start_codon:yes stop_codon:yes gene_type:complete
MISKAEFSLDGHFRYSLSRIWENKLPKVLFIMLNPSIANSKKNDPTIRKIISYSKSWGFGGLYVGNLYSHISPYPKDIRLVKFDFEKKNIESIKKMQEITELTVYAWGNNEKIPNWLKSIIKKPYYIELSKKGTPKHPLYLKQNLKYRKLRL